MNIEETMIAIDGRTGPIAAMTRTVGNMGASARRGICLLDARLRTLSAEPEEGATTAEYAVVLVAATGFAGRAGRVAQIGHHQDVADQHRQEVVECGMTGIHDGDDVTC